MEVLVLDDHQRLTNICSVQTQDQLEDKSGAMEDKDG